ncbi:Protein IWS1 [Schistosoma japonicum]|uniref:Protein IWS1 n=1 Tax=Schistosoma japonicum TaxID=6182 RepID=A0A4Z2DDH7_SCHJA|nr:Protein IWS1 [Schistosoma japonicum]
MLMEDSSFEDESGDEHDGYDPVCSRLVDNQKLAYEPRYVPSEPNENSSSDDLDDDDNLSCSHNSPHSPVDSLKEHSTIKPEYNQFSKNPDYDKEYHIGSIVDVTTPGYAPSQPLSSPESSPALSYSGSEHASDVVSTSKADPDISEEIHQNKEVGHASNSDSDSVINYQKGIHLQEVDDTPRVNSVEKSTVIKYDTSIESSEYNQFHDIFDDNDDNHDQGKFNEDFEGFERDEQPESQVDGIIADIFGESDAEEEFEGFAENELDKGIEEEVEAETSNEFVPNKGHATHEEKDDDESEHDDEFVSDFDRIMEKKKEELRRRRKRNRDIEFLNDSDDLIVETISRMKSAADEDRQLLSASRPATKKLNMLKEVLSLLRRADLKSALIENGMLSAVTEWLSPLPGHTLPNLVIRDSMLTSLNEFQSLSPEVLQESGIGKALMYLYKHPRETRENKDRAGRLINEWLRPIFNLTSDYRTLTKEERKQLDYEHLPKRRNIDCEAYSHRDINRELDGDAKGLLRPGDPGWVNRARVPQPSNKDYIVRPKWRVRENATGDDDDDEGNDEQTEQSQSLSQRHRKTKQSSFGATSRIENHIRNLSNSARRSHAKAARAVQMSIEGRNMSL